MIVKKGFTLIELLIVVAIIAILAAIAVPNFLEAQVRAKVTRGKNDMRAIATGLEAYRIDNTNYPPDSTHYVFVLGYNWVPNPAPNVPSEQLYLLTTPISYMTKVPENVFSEKYVEKAGRNPKYYGYQATQSFKSLQLGELSFSRNAVLNGPNGQLDADLTGAAWAVTSCGPDLANNAGEWLIFGQRVLDRLPAWPGVLDAGAIYDATNGTMSAGDIVRIGP